MLQVNALSCYRREGWLFKELSFSVNGGELLEIRGDNGAGKTTLFKILAGLFDDYEGDVVWSVTKAPLYLGHRFGLNAHLSPAENLSYLTSLSQAIPARENLEAALDKFNLMAVVDQPCRTLSEGQKKRVALSRLALSHAEVWLLDEAFSALDATGRTALTGVCQDHIDAGGAVIFSSHQPVQGLSQPQLVSLGERV